MSKRKIAFLLSLITIVITLSLLLSAAPILIKPLISQPYVPMGTPITWAGFVALPLSIYLGNKELRRPSSRILNVLGISLRVALLLALLWAPICFWLAGNFSFSFTEKVTFRGGQLAMRWFWRYSYFLVVFPLTILLVHRLSKRFGGKAVE